MRHLSRLSLYLFFGCCAYSQEEELRRAAQLDNQGKCDEAERVYSQALAKGSPSAPLLNNVGNHYLICGQPAKAQVYFERLVAFNPEHANANLQLARLATEKKQGKRALQYLAHVRDSGPAIRLLRAEASYYADSQEAALRIFDSLQEEFSSDPRVLFSLGLTCARIGLYERAETAFQSVLVHRPDDYGTLLNFGRAAARAQHYSRAQRALEVAVKLRPSDVEPLLELGLVYAALQDYSRSVYVLAQARKLAPDRTDVLLALGRASEDAGFYGDSVMAYDEYLQIRRDDDIVRRDRARICGFIANRQDEGIKELEQYIAKHAQDPIGHYYLAQLIWNSKPQAALEHLTTALRLNPKFAPAHFAKGWLLYRMGRTADSLSHFEAAVALEPKNVKALDQLGLAYLSLDKPGGAEKVLRRAISVAPENPEVLMHLARALIALDRANEAQTYLDQFRKLRPQKTGKPLTQPVMIELATMSQAERALNQIERLRRDAAAHPSDPELALSFAGALLDSGQVEEALAAYRELLTRNADSSVWRRAGQTLAQSGQYELAVDFLKRAATDSAEARLDLAIALAFTSGPQEALKALGDAPESDRNGDYLLTKARILDSAGQEQESQKLLAEGLSVSSTRPDVAQQTALWLLRRNRAIEALNVITQAAKANPDNPDLVFSQAILLALTDRTRDAQAVLKALENRWPEWDRPYLAHGLLLERAKQVADARQKLQIASALGATDPILTCSVARLNGEVPSSACACATDLRELLIPSCR